MDLNRYCPSRVIKLVILALGGLYAVVLPAQQVTTLMQAYELAKESDPEFQSAIAIRFAAQEAIPQARADLLPSLSADLNSSGNRTKIREAGFAGGFTGGRGTSDFNTTDFNIQFSQPLYRKDRWIALDQAKKIVSQAETVFAFAEQSLMLRLSDRYFGVLGAADTLTFTLAAQEAFGQQLEQSQQRFQVGLVAITDVEEAKAGFDLARAEVISAGNLLDNAREALREVTGDYAEIVARLGESMPLEMPVPNNIDTWTETALQQNLELRGQLEQAERARLEIQRIEAGHVPTLDLVGRYGLTRSNGGVSNGTNQDRTIIGLQLQIPIYQGGIVVSRTRQSRYLYQQELDEQERIRRSVQRQTRNSFLGVQSGISRVQALGQAVVSTQAAAEAIEAGFQVGTRTTVDVLDAQRNLFRSKRDYSLALYTYVLDILRLKLAAGILSEDDLRLINGWLLLK